MAKLLNQRRAIRLLTNDGWTETRGGKHVVKMVKDGQRPVTLPDSHGQSYSKGLSAAIVKQVGSSRRRTAHALQVLIHHDGPEYWSEIAESRMLRAQAER